jgi:prepilin-type N-terminal cleavage/methylation domain-containing protein
MDQAKHNFAPARRGFTLMELTIGMMVTAMVAGASAALLSAVGQGWTQSDSTQDNSLNIVQTHLRIQRVLRGAKQLGLCHAGAIEGSSSAAILIWKADTNLDSQMQFSELALLEHDPADGIIRYYEVVYPSNWTPAQKTAADTPALANDEIYDEGAIDAFKAISYVHATILARGVTGAEFHSFDSSTSLRPSLDYVLKFPNGTDFRLEYGSAAVRTPSTLPSSQY